MISKVMAVNLMGMITRQTISIHVDRQGPMITLENFKITSGSPEIIIVGSLYDPAGASLLSINGIAVPRGRHLGSLQSPDS